MQNNKHQKNERGKQRPWWFSTQGKIAILFIIVVSGYLILNNISDLYVFIPLFHILLCPVFMYLMMKSYHDKNDLKE